MTIILNSLPELPSGSSIILFALIMVIVHLYATWSMKHSNK